MFILLSIVVILLLLPVLKPHDHYPTLRSTDRDELRAAGDLQFLH